MKNAKTGWTWHQVSSLALPLTQWAQRSHLMSQNLHYCARRSGGGGEEATLIDLPFLPASSWPNSYQWFIRTENENWKQKLVRWFTLFRTTHSRESSPTCMFWKGFRTWGRDYGAGRVPWTSVGHWPLGQQCANLKPCIVWILLIMKIKSLTLNSLSSLLIPVFQTPIPRSGGSHPSDVKCSPESIWKGRNEWQKK